MDITPTIIISAKHPEHSKDIKKISLKWEKRTKNNVSPWPKGGTFNVTTCKSMEQRIKAYKPKDKSKKRQGKRELELKVLHFFENAELFPTLPGAANIQGDSEIKDHKISHERPELQIATSISHGAPEPDAICNSDQARGQLPQYQKSPELAPPVQKASSEEHKSPTASAPSLIEMTQGQYVPWQTLDLGGLVARLPDIHRGASRWIRAFEQESVDKLLSVGHIKAVWALCFGTSTMEGILRDSENDWMLSHRADGTDFNAYRAALWRALRAEFPVGVDLEALKGEPLSGTESPAVYIAQQLKKWRQESEGEIEKSPAWVTLFRVSIKEALPAPVQGRLEDVVGLNSMSHGQFRDHVVHAVNKYRKELKRKEQEKDVQRELARLQLEELQAKQEVRNEAMTAGAAEQPSQGQVHRRPCQRSRRGAPGGRRSSGACWACGERGHFVYSCPRAPRNPSVRQDRGQSLGGGASGPVGPRRSSGRGIPVLVYIDI
ncbi:uncharacterized protein PAE49_003635 [Odontesthes bonariensis]